MKICVNISCLNSRENELLSRTQNGICDVFVCVCLCVCVSVSKSKESNFSSFECRALRNGLD